MSISPTQNVPADGIPPPPALQQPRLLGHSPSTSLSPLPLTPVSPPWTRLIRPSRPSLATVVPSTGGVCIPQLENMTGPPCSRTPQTSGLTAVTQRISRNMLPPFNPLASQLTTEVSAHLRTRANTKPSSIGSVWRIPCPTAPSRTSTRYAMQSCRGEKPLASPPGLLSAARPAPDHPLNPPVDTWVPYALVPLSSQSRRRSRLSPPWRASRPPA
ncbi:hypothetical protein C8Q80DRAFT_912226 [Daedaleopsis nitida]|nr:hypothetical protein C8Q80DRAFT_912226 [Daedaleopsis nitida]